MSERYSTAIAELRTLLQKQEQDVRETKKLINKLTVLDGGAAPYLDADSDRPADLGSLRRDQFYGVPLATAIRSYLEMRRASNLGPATVNDLYAALVAGGFKFDAKNERNAKRGLYISLAKNSVTFHKLPGGTDDAAVFGLREWYPAARDTQDEPKKSRPKSSPKFRSKTGAKKALASKPATKGDSGPKLLPAPPKPDEPKTPVKLAGDKPTTSINGAAHTSTKKTTGTAKAEKGGPHEDNGGASPAARTKHNPSPST